MAKSSNVAKPADIRRRTDKELEARVGQLRKVQFNLRFQRATGQLANTALVNHVGKEIARIMTVLGDRKRGHQHPETKKATKAKPV